MSTHLRPPPLAGAHRRLRAPRRPCDTRSATRRVSTPALALAVALVGLASAPASAELSDLTQKTTVAGCVTVDGTGGTPGGQCALGPTLVRTNTLALSPDGKHAYASTSPGLTIFDRDPATGALAQKPGTAGCISRDGAGGCAVGTNIPPGGGGDPLGVSVSPDGKNLYVLVSLSGGAVVAFDRDLTTGVLTEKTGPAGCTAEQGDGVTCADGVALANPSSLSFSPDGKHVYITGSREPESQSILTFDRNTTTGVLTQKVGTAGCIASSSKGGACVAIGGLIRNPRESIVSADGKHVYVTSPEGDASVLLFDRDAATGVLTLRAGPQGCVARPPTVTCTPAIAVSSAWGIALSPDGKHAYTAGHESEGGLVTFDRDPVTGALTQKTGTSGCITFTGTNGDCAVGTGYQRISDSIAVAPDGKSVYMTVGYGVSGVGGVLIHDRNPTTGVLTQKPGTAGCITQDGIAREERVPGVCLAGRALAGANDVIIGPEGTTVYVASRGSASGGIAILDRDRGDITPAETTIGFGPAEGSATADSTPTFIFSSDGGSTFECKLDAGAFAPCASPFTTATLSDGPHTLTVLATDAAGNVDGSPATRAFTVDTAAPDTSIASGPSGTTGEGKPTFGLASTEAGSTFECRVDGGAFARCGSQHTTAALADGAHTFQARATDAAGNVDATPAARAFAVDTVTPQTAISSGPAARTADPTPTFAFGASVAGSTFQCRVDGGEFAGCVSPHETAPLADGPHSFEVRATGPFGAADRTPARARFTVDTAVAAAPAPPPPRGGPINGTPGADRLVGTPGNDVINCGGGDDVVVAGGGDDVINCGAGNDTIDAGAGNDRVAGGPGNDRVTGGAGNDSVSGNAGNDSLSGNAGNDRLLGGAGRDRLLGGPGRDTLTGGGGLDVLNGGPGKDRERQ